MVARLCVTTTNCVRCARRCSSSRTRTTLDSSRAASTSSSRQNGLGLTVRIENRRATAVSARSPPESSPRFCRRFARWLGLDVDAGRAILVVAADQPSLATTEQSGECGSRKHEPLRRRYDRTPRPSSIELGHEGARCRSPNGRRRVVGAERRNVPPRVHIARSHRPRPRRCDAGVPEAGRCHAPAGEDLRHWQHQCC